MQNWGGGSNPQKVKVGTDQRKRKRNILNFNRGKKISEWPQTVKEKLIDLVQNFIRSKQNQHPIIS